MNVIKQIEGPTSSVDCSLVGSWGYANFIIDGMIRNNPEEYKTLSPTVSFIFMCGLFKMYVYDKFSGLSSSDKNESEVHGGADVEIITSERYIKYYFGTYCCRNIFMLSIMYVKHCFKQGKYFMTTRLHELQGLLRMNVHRFWTYYS